MIHEVRKAKTNYYKRQFVNVKDDPKKAWKIGNKILNRENKSSDINCINYETHQISNPNELAECFNNYFTSIGPEIANGIDSSDVNFSDNIMNISSRFNFQTISVSKFISSLLR